MSEFYGDDEDFQCKDSDSDKTTKDVRELRELRELREFVVRYTPKGLDKGDIDETVWQKYHDKDGCIRVCYVGGVPCVLPIRTSKL